MCCFRLTDQACNRAKHLIPMNKALCGAWKALWGPLEGWAEEEWQFFCDNHFTPEERRAMGVARQVEANNATPPEYQMQFRYCSGKQVTARMEASTTHRLRWTVKELRAGRRQHQYTSPLLVLLLLLLSFQFTNHHFNPWTHTPQPRRPCLIARQSCYSW